MSPEDRRRWPRYPEELLVYFRPITDIESAFLPVNKQAKTKNVSRGGLGIILDEYVQPGSLLKVDLAIPNKSRLLTAYCRVVWINRDESSGKFNAGLEIEEMDESMQDEFYEFISKLKEEQNG